VKSPAGPAYRAGGLAARQESRPRRHLSHGLVALPKCPSGTHCQPASPLDEIVGQENFLRKGGKYGRNSFQSFFEL
jgi:hypothetical protein